MSLDIIIRRARIYDGSGSQPFLGDVGVLGDRIAAVAPGGGEGEPVRAAVVPGLADLHSHAFQRAMAGMTERRATGRDDFWSWRELMYRFLDVLTPAQVEAIAAQVSAARIAVFFMISLR